MAGDRPMGLGRQQREWLMKRTYTSFIQEVQVVETTLNNSRCLQDVAWRDGEDERGGEVVGRGAKEDGGMSQNALVERQERIGCAGERSESTAALYPIE